MYFPFSKETYKMTDFVKTLSPAPLSLPKQLAITTFKIKFLMIPNIFDLLSFTNYLDMRHVHFLV
jgi:hypothetical protein